MCDSMDEYDVHQLKTFDETELKLETKEELHLGDKNAKNMLEELEIVSVPLNQLTKETLVDKSDPCE